MQSLKTNNNTLALASAAISRAKESPGKWDLGSVFMESMKNPQKVRTSLDAADKIPIIMSPDDALALKIQCDLSDNQYQLLRNASLKHNANIFPPLHSILSVKTLCYPEETAITETSAKSTLQSMADHTVSRILQLKTDCFNDLQSDCSGIMYLKVGMDAVSSQSIYNQKLSETDLDEGIQMKRHYFRQLLYL